MNLQIQCIYFSTLVLHLWAQNGGPCTTPDRNPGFCRNLNECPALLDLLLTQNTNNTVRAFLKSSLCGSQGNVPLVCCANQPTANNGASSQILPKSPNCGFSNMTNGRIVNGVPAKLGEFPWIVALGYRNNQNPALPRWFCGGSLITDRHILTAAHCVYNRDDLYLARLGDLDLFTDDDGATPSNIFIASTKIHENFNPAKYINDIALLTLQQPVRNPTVWPICLPVNQPYRSMTYLNFAPTLAGWGSISFRGPSSSQLQEIFVPVVNNDNCQRVFAQRAIIDERIICAGSGNGDKDACGGDSGAPLMHQINEGNSFRTYQIGIVSYGFKCAEPGYPSVYTRITAFMDWIEKNVT